METTLPQNVIDARGEVQRAGATLGQFNSKGFTIEDELKKTVQEALDYNKDIIEKRSGALADYLKAPADAGVRYGVQQFTTGDQAGQENQDFVWNPFERNKLIQGAIGNAMIPFSTYNTLLGMREGQVGDLVGAGTRAFQAAQAAAQSQAQQAQQYYSNVLGEFTTLQDIQAKQMELDQAQQRIELAKLEAAKAGSGSGIPGLSAMLGSIMGNNQQQAPVYGPQEVPFTYQSNVTQQIPQEWTQPDYFGWALENAGNSFNSLKDYVTQEDKKATQAKADAPWYVKWLM